jgi:hypothetical protein
VPVVDVPVVDVPVVDVLVGAEVSTGVSLDDGVTAQPPSRTTTATASPHGVLMSRTYPAGGLTCLRCSRAC